MRDIELISEGCYYHIYNRGIDGTNIFRAPSDYSLFLEKYQEYTKDILETFAYCLLKNHFHLLAYVKENVIVERKDGKGMIKLNASKQIGHFFNAYAQKFNYKYKRTGSLFESPFKRKSIESDEYFTSVLFYVHTNAVHHSFVKDFRDWSYSSYNELLCDTSTFLHRQMVMDWFGGKDAFINYHLGNVELINKEEWIIE